MTTPNDGWNSPPPGPPVPPPPPPMPPGPYPQQSTTKLPMVSLILGILSLICGGLILGIPAIITGFIGRKKAKATGQGTGMAVGGIITGILGTILSIVVAILVIGGGISIFNTAKDQVKIAGELQDASAAAELYGTANAQNYAALSTEQLAQYGYQPSSDVNVKVVPINGGSSFCIEGNLISQPDTVIHVPVLRGETDIQITINDHSYRYSGGPCPTG